MVKISKFDAAEYLDSPEMIAAYLSEAYDSDDDALISDAVTTVSRATGIDLRPIRSDEEHRAALKQIESLWEAPQDTVEAKKLGLLASLVRAYENKRWPS